MTRHNKNFNQRPSQRPAHTQVATRPAAVEEPPLDIERVPSAATETQSQADANALDTDRYAAQPGITDTDSLVTEASDVGEDTDTGDDEEDFSDFEDIGERPPRHVSQKQGHPEERLVQAPVRINRTEVEQQEYDSELVPIIPRKTQMRNYVSGEWYNLIKGVEQFVPRSVERHFKDKGLI
jgi:hypothetical protein